MRRLSLLGAAALIAACDRTPPPPSPAETAPKWRLDDVGSIAGPTPRQRFVKVRGIALQPSGRFAVVDKGNKLVTLFDTSGRPLGSVGMEGKGAGQYQEPYSAAWLGDTLAIFDDIGGRVLYFTNGMKPNGETVTIPLNGDETVRWYPVSPSEAYLRSVRFDGTKFSSVFLKFQGRGPRDTLPLPEPPRLSNGTSCKTEGGGVTHFEWPEAPIQLAVPVRADGSLATAITNEYRILIRSPKNDTLATLRAKTAPVSILNGEWDDGLKEYYKFLTRHVEATCDAKPTRPSHRAPIRAMTVSLDGDVWVTVLDGPTLRFDVYGADGKIKGTLPAPPHNVETPLVVAGDRVLMVAPGPGGGDVVHLYHLVH